MNNAEYQSLDFQFLTEEKMLENSRNFLDLLQRRRTVRSFSKRNFPKEIIDNCIQAASSAPSGANKQPWKFVIVSDAIVKKRIREAAEKEERKFYNGKAGVEWLEALSPLGTDANKPFLETAPYLIVIFEEKYIEKEDGTKKKNYYTKESVGIATGFLIAALHNSGLATLTHTPSPMNFLNEILERPQNEKPFLILVAGYPAEGTNVPCLKRKKLNEVAVYI